MAQEKNNRTIEDWSVELVPPGTRSSLYIFLVDSGGESQAILLTSQLVVHCAIFSVQNCISDDIGSPGDIIAV